MEITLSESTVLRSVFTLFINDDNNLAHSIMRSKKTRLNKFKSRLTMSELTVNFPFGNSPNVYTCMLHMLEIDFVFAEEIAQMAK